MLPFFHDYPDALCGVYTIIVKNGWLWIMQETFLGVACALSVPFTSRLLSFWLGGAGGDVLSRNVLCLTLLLMVIMSSAIFYTRDAVDRLVRMSLVVANVLARGGLLLNALYALYFVAGFNPVALKGDCVFMAVLLLGDIARLRKLSRKDFHLVFDEKEKICTNIDLAITALVGPLTVIFPRTFANFFLFFDVTEVHLMLIRSFGFQMIALSLLSGVSLCYENLMDVACILRAKFVLYIPALFASFWCMITTEPGPTNWGCVLVGFASLILSINCLVAQVDFYELESERIKFEKIYSEPNAQETH